MSEKLELEDFIQNHYQLIAIIGVFGALTAFFVRLEGFENLAFIPLAIFFVLMWELLDSFPEIEMPLKSSVSLLTFELLMVALLFAVGWYILVVYVSVYYKVFVLAFFLGLYTLVSVKIIVRINLFARINRRLKGEPYKSVRLVILGVMIWSILLLSSYSANFIISLIEGTA